MFGAGVCQYHRIAVVVDERRKALLGCGVVFGLAAIALLGKSGFTYLKGQLFAVIKRYGPPKDVSRTRYHPAFPRWPAIPCGSEA